MESRLLRPKKLQTPVRFKIENIEFGFEENKPKLVLFMPNASQAQVLAEELQKWNIENIHWDFKNKRLTVIGKRAISDAGTVIESLYESPNGFEFFLKKVRNGSFKTLALPRKSVPLSLFQKTSGAYEEGSHPVKKYQRADDHSIHYIKEHGKILRDNGNVDDLSNISWVGKTTEIESFLSACYRLWLGPRRAPEMETVYEEFEENGNRTYRRVGTASKEIPNLTPADTAVKTQERSKRNAYKTIPVKKALWKTLSTDQLIEAGIAEQLVTQYLLEESDAQESNWAYDDQQHITLVYDFGQGLFSESSKYSGIESDAPKKFIDTHGQYSEIPAPRTSFPITILDLINFPRLTNAKPIRWWLDDQHKLYKHPEFIKRKWRAFLKIIITPSNAVQVLARDYFGSENAQEKNTTHVFNRIENLRKKLLSIPEFKEYVRNNPQWLDEFKQEFEIYNANLKKEDADFAVDLTKVEGAFSDIQKQCSLSRGITLLDNNNVSISNRSKGSPSNSDEDSDEAKETSSLITPTNSIQQMTKDWIIDYNREQRLLDEHIKKLAENSPIKLSLNKVLVQIKFIRNMQTDTTLACEVRELTQALIATRELSEAYEEAQKNPGNISINSPKKTPTASSSKTKFETALKNYHRITNRVQGRPARVWQILGGFMMGLGVLISGAGLAAGFITAIPTFGLGGVAGLKVAGAGALIALAGFGLYRLGSRTGLSKSMVELEQTVKKNKPIQLT